MDTVLRHWKKQKITGSKVNMEHQTQLQSYFHGETPELRTPDEKGYCLDGKAYMQFFLVILLAMQEGTYFVGFSLLQCPVKHIELRLCLLCPKMWQPSFSLHWWPSFLQWWRVSKLPLCRLFVS